MNHGDALLCSDEIRIPSSPTLPTIIFCIILLISGHASSLIAGRIDETGSEREIERNTNKRTNNNQ